MDVEGIGVAWWWWRDRDEDGSKEGSKERERRRRDGGLLPLPQRFRYPWQCVWNSMKESIIYS